MGDIQEKEIIEVVQCHDNDKYIIKRDIHSTQEVNGEELLKIYVEIGNSVTEQQKQLKELPDLVKKKTEDLQKAIALLQPRLDAFAKQAKKIKPKENPITG